MQLVKNGMILLKKILYCCILTLFFIDNALPQQNNKKYEKEWEKIDILIEEQDLPQTATAEINKLLKKAIDNENDTQIIKGLIYKNKLKKKTSYYHEESFLYDLEDYAQQTNNNSIKALLYSMLAEAYSNYFNYNYYQINKEINLLDTIPVDIKKWTTNIFAAKISECLKISISEKERLKKNKTSHYSDIIELGQDKVRYPTLYDFLMKRAIDISCEHYIRKNNYSEPARRLLAIPEDDDIHPNTEEPAAIPANFDIEVLENSICDRDIEPLAYFNDYLSDLLKRKMTATIVLIEIDKLKFFQSCNFLSAREVFEALIQLEQKYRSNPNNSEIISEIVNTYPEAYPEQSLFETNESKYKWLQKGLKRYPSSYGARKLERQLGKLERASLRLTGRENLHPSEKQIISIIHKNTDTDPFIFTLYKQIGEEYKKVKSYSFSLKSKTTYNTDTLQYNLGQLDVGKYLFSTYDEIEINELSDSYSLTDLFHFTVSALMYYSLKSNENEYEVFVADYLTGQPLEGANVDFLYKNKIVENVKTDTMGIACFNLLEKEVEQYKVSLGNDSSRQLESLYSPYNWQKPRERKKMPVDQLNIFLDRSIYRPGQTLYYKVIVSDSLGCARKNAKCSVFLNNANDQWIERQEYTTNDFGSITGQFTLPKSGLLGNYYLMISSGEGYAKYFFKVEEYKRPTFYISFNPLTESDSLDKEISVKGYAQSFSGEAVGGAKVKYTIQREYFFFSVNRSISSGMENLLGRPDRPQLISDGETTTKMDGSFDIVFNTETDIKDNRIGKRNYTFRITATVTDINGEVQEESYFVNTGEKPINIDIGIKDREEKSTLSHIEIKAQNLNEEYLSLRGSYALYRVSTSKDTTEIRSDSLTTGEYLRLTPNSLPSGRYLLAVTLSDDKGKELKESKEFILYSYNDSCPPIKTNEWIVEKDNHFSAEKEAEVIFGVSDNDVYVLYQLTDGYRIFERKMLKMSNECRLFTVPYKDIYNDEIYMVFSFIQNGKLTVNQIRLEKIEKEESKNLILKMNTFRDKLLPGQNEKWSIKIENDHGDSGIYEVLASMYDVSLDKLWRATAWDFHLASKPKISASKLSFDKPYLFNYWENIISRSFSPYTRLSDIQVTSQSNTQVTSPPLSFNSSTVPKVPRFDQLNWFGYMHNYQPELYIFSLSELSKLYKGTTVFIETIETIETEYGYGVDIADLKEHKVILSEENASTWGTPLESVDIKPQIRKKFDETAFFYPQLETNSSGETLISFTMPESNTTWRFRAFAHDKTGRNGIIQKFVTTSKPLMVTPNLPRFLRNGDKAILSAKITNLAPDTQMGEVYIEFFDPETERVIDLGIEKSKQTFFIFENESQSVNWQVKIPENIEFIGCRIIAGNEYFSDGEQHLLPILSNKILITESMPINIYGKGKKTFIMDRLYNKSLETVDNYRLTFEYTDNPVWYIIKALPTLIAPSEKDVVSWFSSYYANSVAEFLYNKNSKLYYQLNHLDISNLNSSDNNTHILNLADDDVKSIILTETPWIAEAKTEANQIQELKTLLDKQNIATNKKQASDQINNLSTQDGWSWHKGMNTNISLTLYMLQNLSKLSSLVKEDHPSEIQQCEKKALSFLDKEINDSFTKLQEDSAWQDISNISSCQLEYIYTRSFYNYIPIDKPAKEAFDFYLKVATKNWLKLNLYERAILSTTLNRIGQKDNARKIVQSIREYAIKDPILGMYWPESNLHMFTALSNISYHLYLTEALMEQGILNEEQELLTRWILNKKQTCSWGESSVTIDAINLLLNLGADWVKSERKPTKISVGNENFRIDNYDSNVLSGYKKKTWNQEDIRNENAKIKINSPDNIPGYGALYWQYYEYTEQVEPQNGALNIKKQLFQEIVRNGEKGLLKIDTISTLDIGDKIIIRLTIETDRDMQYVHIKNTQAACFKPLGNISSAKWMDNISYYKTSKDASCHFYIEHLPKGVYTLDYPVHITHRGEYNDGMATIQCMYAPQFTSHSSAGSKILIKGK